MSRGRKPKTWRVRLADMVAESDRLFTVSGDVDIYNISVPFGPGEVLVDFDADFRRLQGLCNHINDREFCAAAPERLCFAGLNSRRHTEGPASGELHFALRREPWPVLDDAKGIRLYSLADFDAIDAIDARTE